MKSLTVLAVALTAASLQAHNPHRITPPPVPAGIEVPAGNKAFLVGHAYRHPELHLPALGHRLRLVTLHAAGHAVQRR